MDWKTVKLIDISKPKQWKNLPSSKLLDVGYKVYGANGVIGNYSEYTHEKPTLAITCRGATSGNIHLTEPLSYINSNAMALDEIDESKFDLKFLYYALLERGLKDTISGSAQPQITRTSLKRVKLNVPINLKDQKCIAKVLSDCEILINKRKESIALLDELIDSTFLEMFGDAVTNDKGWQIERLGEICGVGSGKRVFTKELVDEGIPFFRGTEIGRLAEGIKIKPTLFITTDHYNKLKNHTSVPKIGDLLMPSICPDGRIHVVSNNNPFYFKDGRVLWIKVNNINSLYLRFFLKALFLRSYDKIASGTTFAELKIVALKKIKVLYPPINLQNRFSKIVEKIQIIKEHYQTHLQELENLYGSISQKAFKGELDLSNVLLRETKYFSNDPNETPESFKKEMDAILEEKDNDEVTDVEFEEILPEDEDYEIIKEVSDKTDIEDRFTEDGAPVDVTFEEVEENEVADVEVEEISHYIKNKLVVEQPYKLIDFEKVAQGDIISRSEPETLEWDDLSSERIAKLIKRRFKNYHFSMDMLQNYLTKKRINVAYYSSEELKKKPLLNAKQDLKKFIFSAIEPQDKDDPNPFLSINQHFYDATKENLVLKLQSKDYKIFKEKNEYQRSGIYFTVNQ